MKFDAICSWISPFRLAHDMLDGGFLDLHVHDTNNARVTEGSLLSLFLWCILGSVIVAALRRIFRAPT